MPRVAIIVNEGVLAAPVSELSQVLTLANRYAEEQYGGLELLPRALEVFFASLDGRSVTDASGRLVGVDANLAAAECHLAYVAPLAIGAPDMLATKLEALNEVTAWLSDRHDQGTVVAASGSAVAFVARAGLIADGDPVPVPWWLEAPMRRLFPSLRIDAQRKLAISGDILLAGAQAAEPALAVRIVERIMSPDLAGWVERVTGIDPYPDGVEPGLDLQFPALRHDELVRRAAHWLQLRFARRPAIEEAAAAMGVHPRTLSRRFRAAFGVTPVAYLQRLRIEAAKRMLALSDRKVERVAYLVGYSDVAFFKAVFRKHCGMTPAAYRRASGLVNARTLGSAG